MGVSEAKLGVFCESWFQTGRVSEPGISVDEGNRVLQEQDHQHSKFSWGFGNQCLFCAFCEYPILSISHLSFYPAPFSFIKKYKKSKDRDFLSLFITQSSKPPIPNMSLMTPESAAQRSFAEIPSGKSLFMLPCAADPTFHSLPIPQKNTGSLPASQPECCWCLTKGE